MVGKTRFELATPCTPCKYATGLRHFPNKWGAKIRLNSFLQNTFWNCYLRTIHIFMDILLRKAVIQDPASTYSGKKMDLLIRDGVISEIEQHIDAPPGATLVEHENLFVSPGWIETFSNFCDPGYEHKENLETGAAAAAAGGFTRVFVVPNTSPTLHTKSQIEYIIEKSKRLPVYIHPIGALTKNTEGKELTEIYDMFASQAVAFSDGFQPVQSAGLLIKALQYAKAIDGVVIQVPEDRTIQPGGLMNEGIVSTRLGLPGKPVLSEVLMLQRDLELNRYADSELHFTGITSAKSVELIRKAKAEGLRVSCSVTPHHLFFCDEDLADYNTNLKVSPPIRTAADRLALREGLLDGTIDMIACHHQPHEWDSKTCEFEYAQSGIIGLESCFGVLGALQLPIEKIIEFLCIQPRNRFKLKQPAIEKGCVAELTLFNPDCEYVFEQTDLRSASSNSPFMGMTLKGKVIGILNKDSLFLNDIKL